MQYFDLFIVIACYTAFFLICTYLEYLNIAFVAFVCRSEFYIFGV